MKKSSGFTLIEVLLATIILAGALIALTSSWSGTIFSFKRSEKIQIITSLLKSKSAELEIKYSKLGFTEIPEDEEGDFGKEFPDLTWKSEVKDLEFPDLTALIIGKEGHSDETTLSMVKQMTEYFSKNIKEFRVTVMWQASKKKAANYSMTTYIVNYNGGLPGGMGGGGGAGAAGTGGTGGAGGAGGGGGTGP
jgi:prepilin-type N-terminal cleavage/methylation domain-containing protein